MKTIPSIIAASLFLVAAGASADDYGKRVDSNTIVLGAVQTKEAAYQLGLNKVNQLKSMTALELSRTLQINSIDAVFNTVSLEDDASITVNEQMDANGHLAYLSNVNVGFSYINNDTDK